MFNNALLKKLNNIVNTKFFYDVYLAILSLITIFGFLFNPIVGIEILIISSFFMLLITNDMKYIIPNLLFIIFNINNGFKVDEIPVFLIITVSIIIIMLVFFTIKNKPNLYKMKSIVGFIGLAIVEIIPIFWNKTLNGDNKALYFLYFGNLGYLLIYFFFSNGIKSESIKYLAKSFSFLLIIISVECLIKVIELKDIVDNIVTLWYYLGWGLCNEAAIMILVALPFSFYLITKEKNVYLIIIELFKIVFGIMGIILTFSRGGYIFLPIEIGILVVLTIIFNYKRKGFKYFFYGITITVLIFILATINNIKEFNYNVIHVMFSNGLNDSGRIDLYRSAFHIFKSNGLYNLLGSGIVSEVAGLSTAYGFQANAVVIYHSTLFETLVIGGLIGFIFLLIIIKDKYVSLYKSDKTLFWFLLVGYVIVDIYGMADNTYHMYYYMIALSIIMASIDSDNYYNNKEIDYMKLF